jgi:hypothetical protein
MGLTVIKIHAKGLWSLTDFPLGFYNFLTFISCALKNIHSIGQPILKNKANLIHPFAGGISQNRMVYITSEKVG